MLAGSICFPLPIATHAVLFFRPAEHLMVLSAPRVAIITGSERSPVHLLLVKNDFFSLILIPNPSVA